MAQLDRLFERYDKLMIFDTETTGLVYSRDEIIEFAAVVLEKRDGKVCVVEEYDELIRNRMTIKAPDTEIKPRGGRIIE